MKRKISVIASHASSLDELVKVELANFACDDCGNSTVTVAGTQPFCIHCSSENTNEVEVAEASIYDTAEEELSSITCPHCHTSNILPDVELASLEGKMGCVTCGTGLSFEVAAEQAEDNEDEVDDQHDEKTKEQDMDVEEAAEEVDVEDGGEESDDDNSMSEDEPDEDAAEASTDEEVVADVEVEEASEVEADEVVAGGEGDMDDDEEVDVEMEPDETEESSLETEEAEVIVEVPESTEAKLLDIVMSGLDEEETASVNFVPYGDKILAMVNDIHVATATKTEETANADIFGSDEYMSALAQTFEAEGFDAALAQYNFVLSAVDVGEQVMHNYAVARAAEEASANVEETLANYRADLMQSVEIAATGLNRDFFANHEHVVKARLVQDLTAAGVRNAQHLVDTAYAETEDQHTATLFEIASDLVGRDRQARNDMSDAVTSVRAPIAAPEQSAEAALEESLVTPLKPQVETATLVKHAKPSGGSRVREMANARGGLFAKR
ncbi:hypothetical protein GR11A_00073 [Vibrio phage vB_VcorM_GR11A]|nr:hypothetical protein GR11A_00073 [Vibrio phage vB_VcorM_GR11A]